MGDRTGAHYKPGELEVILSLAPTKPNIHWLSLLLERTPEAIEIVYRIAFCHERFGSGAKAQNQKILDAKKRIEITIGRTEPPE
jgi:hypothetical protein